MASSKVGGFYRESRRFKSPRLEGNIYIGRQLSYGDKVLMRFVVTPEVLSTHRKGGLQEGEPYPECPAQVCISCVCIRIHLGDELWGKAVTPQD